MITIAAIAAVSGIATLGIAVLPWKANELDDTLDALEAVPDVLIGAAAAPLEGGVATAS